MPWAIGRNARVAGEKGAISWFCSLNRLRSFLRSMATGGWHFVQVKADRPPFDARPGPPPGFDGRPRRVQMSSLELQSHRPPFEYGLGASLGVDQARKRGPPGFDGRGRLSALNSETFT